MRIYAKNKVLANKKCFTVNDFTSMCHFSETVEKDVKAEQSQKSLQDRIVESPGKENCAADMCTSNEQDNSSKACEMKLFQEAKLDNFMDVDSQPVVKTRSRSKRKSRVTEGGETNKPEDRLTEEESEGKKSSVRKTRSKSKRSRTSTFGTEDSTESESEVTGKRTKKRSRRSVSVKDKGDLEISVSMSPESKNTVSSESKESMDSTSVLDGEKVAGKSLAVVLTRVDVSDGTASSEDDPKKRSSQKSRKSVSKPSTPLKSQDINGAENGASSDSSSRRTRKSVAGTSMVIDTAQESYSEAVDKPSTRKTRKSIARSSSPAIAAHKDDSNDEGLERPLGRKTGDL